MDALLFQLFGGADAFPGGGDFNEYSHAFVFVHFNELLCAAHRGFSIE